MGWGVLLFFPTSGKREFPCHHIQWGCGVPCFCCCLHVAENIKCNHRAKGCWCSEVEETPSEPPYQRSIAQQRAPFKCSSHDPPCPLQVRMPDNAFSWGLSSESFKPNQAMSSWPRPTSAAFTHPECVGVLKSHHRDLEHPCNSQQKADILWKMKAVSSFLHAASMEESLREPHLLVTQAYVLQGLEKAAFKQKSFARMMCLGGETGSQKEHSTCFQVVLVAKNLPADAGDVRDSGLIPWVGKIPQSITHSNILAWRIPWTEQPGGLQSMGSQRVRHD